MKTYQIFAENGTVFGDYESETEQQALDLCAQDAGYESLKDMENRLEHPSVLKARELEG